MSKIKTSDPQVQKTIEQLKAGTKPADLLSRDELRKLYRQLDCQALHGIKADDCSKVELINGVKQRLGLFEQRSSGLQAGVGSVTGSDDLEIPDFLKRPTSVEGSARVDQIVREVNEGRKVPKMPATATSKPYAKSNVETGTKMQKWYFKSDKGSKDLPKQAQQILAVVLDAGDQGIDRERISLVLKGVIKTKQPIDRIVSFYRSKLVGGGFVKVV